MSETRGPRFGRSTQIEDVYDELRCVEEKLAVAVEAMEKFDREFLQVYHPWKNWFPQTLVIKEALEKIKGGE